MFLETTFSRFYVGDLLGISPVWRCWILVFGAFGAFGTFLVVLSNSVDSTNVPEFCSRVYKKVTSVDRDRVTRLR